MKKIVIKLLFTELAFLLPFVFAFNQKKRGWAADYFNFAIIFIVTCRQIPGIGSSR